MAPRGVVGPPIPKPDIDIYCCTAVLTKTDTVWPCLASIATFTPTFNFNMYVLYDILFIVVHHALTLHVHLSDVLHFSVVFVSVCEYI